MKTINTVVAAMALSTLSFGVFAAEPVTASQAQNMNKIGVVSADGASTLDALEAKLAKKAAAAGASGYSCLMRRYRVLSGLQNPNRWTDQAFTLRPAQVFPCLFADRRICSNPH